MLSAHKLKPSEAAANKIDSDLGEIRPKWITYDGEVLYEGIHYTVEVHQGIPCYIVPTDWTIEEGMVVGLHV